MEGRSIAIVARSAEGRSERYAEIAAEFVRLKVDVIVTSGTPVSFERPSFTWRGCSRLFSAISLDISQYKLVVRYTLLVCMHGEKCVEQAQVCQGPPEGSANERSSGIMAQVVVRMKTIDLRKAELQPVAGEDVKTLQALLISSSPPATSARTAPRSRP